MARWLTMMTWRGRRHLLRGADDAELTRLAIQLGHLDGTADPAA